MAFAFLGEEGFEAGTIGRFDTETDTESRLDVAHYSTLARDPRGGAPFRGAYALRVQLQNDGTPADAYVQETGDADTGADGTAWVRFAFYISKDIVMANNDELAIFQIWSASNTVEGGVYLNFTTANGLRLGIGETSGSVFKPIQTGIWHMVEFGFNVDAGGGNDGTIDGALDGSAYTQVATLDQGVITSCVLGVLAQDAGTTQGFLLFDEFVLDDARIFPITDRFSPSMKITGSQHVFVGPGTVHNASLMSGAGTDCVLELFDTDTAYVSDAANVRLELKNTANNELVDPAGMPLHFHRGCYARLTGTTPRAQIQICNGVAHSDGGIRALGIKRIPHPVMG